MTEDNRERSNTVPDPKTNPNRPAKRGAKEDPEARRAFERDRLHPALRLDQQYPAVTPERRWSVAKDDATAPARPSVPETLTDLAPEPVDTPTQKGIRSLSLLMSLIIIFGVVVLLVLVTQPRGL